MQVGSDRRDTFVRHAKPPPIPQTWDHIGQNTHTNLISLAALAITPGPSCFSQGPQRDSDSVESCAAISGAWRATLRSIYCRERGDKWEIIRSTGARAKQNEKAHTARSQCAPIFLRTSVSNETPDHFVSFKDNHFHQLVRSVGCSL